MFQSTPPCGGRHHTWGTLIHSLKFQSTPPCGGRPERPRGLRDQCVVSIHAPVRGATGGAEAGLTVSVVSIHAPVRGATRRHGGACYTGGGFNPRPRAGGDLIRAIYLITKNCFNPRPRAGGDTTSRFLTATARCFNPRPRAGGDSTAWEPLSGKGSQADFSEPIIYEVNISKQPWLYCSKLLKNGTWGTIMQLC